MIPGYWMNETSGVLRPAIEAYLAGGEMSGEHIAAMRAYLRQWINAPGFSGRDVIALRAFVNELTDRKKIDGWIDYATEIGCDPL